MNAEKVTPVKVSKADRDEVYRATLAQARREKAKEADARRTS